MRRARSLPLLMLAAGLSLSGGSPGTAARARRVAGVVTFMKGEPMSGARDLKRNSFVYEGDSLKTGPGGCVAVAFVGGAELRLNEGSELGVERGGGPGPGKASLRSGQAWIGLANERPVFMLAGPLALATISKGEGYVRGEVDVSVGELMVVKAYAGSADIENGSGRQSVQQGQKVEVGGDGPAAARPLDMVPADRGTWQDGCKGKSLPGASGAVPAPARSPSRAARGKISAGRGGTRALKRRLTGAFYDLGTLKPVADVEVLLVGAAGRSVRTLSGPDGRFRASLPADGRGCEMRVRHDGYLSGAVIDGKPSYLGLDESARKKAARSIKAAPPSDPTLFQYGEDRLELDFILIPRD